MKKNKDSIGDFFDVPKRRSKKRKTRKAKGPKLILISIKMTPEQHKQLVAKARRIAQGNVSALIRHWAEGYVPKPGERARLEAA